jgi:hypothetical protein
MSSAIVTAPPRFGIGAERYDGGIRRCNLVAGLAAVDPGAGLRPLVGASRWSATRSAHHGETAKRRRGSFVVRPIRHRIEQA